jgi:hypothetical protein
MQDRASVPATIVELFFTSLCQVLRCRYPLPVQLFLHPFALCVKVRVSATCAAFLHPFALCVKVSVSATCAAFFYIPLPCVLRCRQGVIKRCRLPLLTNSTLLIRVQMRGEGGSCGVPANEYSCAHHVTWSPNKLWRSTSIFNLWVPVSATCAAFLHPFALCKSPGTRYPLHLSFFLLPFSLFSCEGAEFGAGPRQHRDRDLRDGGNPGGGRKGSREPPRRRRRR